MAEIEIRDIGGGKWRLLTRFSLIDRVLKNTAHGEVVYITGQNLTEEFNDYRKSLSHTQEYYGIIVDRDANHPFDLMRGPYWGNTGRLRKLIAFLSSNTMPISGQIDAEKLISPSNDFVQSIADYIRNDYLLTRKIVAGADGEISSIISRISKLSFSGPIIIHLKRGGPSYLQWLVLANIAMSGNKFQLVLLLDDVDAQKYDLPASIKRLALSYGTLVALVSSAFKLTKPEVSRYYDLWSASQTYRAHVSANGGISVRDASSFVEFIGTIDTSVDSIEIASRSIPKRIVAPLMFVQGDNSIEFDHASASGLSRSAARGAARALRGQAEELLQIGSLDNAMPGISAVISRMSATLLRLDQNDRAEEADIIELGVDFSYFEHRIYDGKDRIGDLAKGELLGFTHEAGRYLARFESWKNYREETKDQGASEEAFTLASQILEKAVNAGILSDDATAKVLTALGETRTADDGGLREGVARSSENLAAVVGRGALTALKAGGEGLAKEAGKQTATAVVTSSKAFLIANTPALIKLAQLRAGRWIEMVVGLFND